VFDDCSLGVDEGRLSFVIASGSSFGLELGPVVGNEIGNELGSKLGMVLLILGLSLGSSSGTPVTDSELGFMEVLGNLLCALTGLKLTSFDGDKLDVFIGLELCNVLPVGIVDGT
jgi:hypothetical protein